MREIKVTGATIEIHFIDGKKLVAEVSEKCIADLLEASGYVMPRRYDLSRSVSSLTKAELYDALHIYDLTKDWDEVSNVMCVDKSDLMRVMSKKKRAEYRAWHKTQKECA